MTYIAKELLPKLTYLTLVGVDDDGELEWIGTSSEWETTGKWKLAENNEK